MPYSFTAKIYRTGINLCVDVPQKITLKMKPVKGYIYIKGTINSYAFTQTLVPVKAAPYRLFVNNIMIKVSGAKLNDKARFSIEQDLEPRPEPFPTLLKKVLLKNNLYDEFDLLTPSRKKEIFRYLNQLKSKESLEKNVEKVITQLKTKSKDSKGFLRALDQKKKT